MSAARRCAVLGSPVAHSLSPVLHRAAYAALGLAISAGILSGPTETVFSLKGQSPNRVHLSVDRVMRTDYRIDDFQQNYFVIDSFDQLLKVTLETDFGPLYQRLAGDRDIPIAAILPEDMVFTRGDQSHVAGARQPV